MGHMLMAKIFAQRIQKALKPATHKGFFNKPQKEGKKADNMITGAGFLGPVESRMLMLNSLQVTAIASTSDLRTKRSTLT